MTARPDTIDLAARLAAVRPARVIRVAPKLARGTMDLRPEQVPCFGGEEAR